MKKLTIPSAGEEESQSLAGGNVKQDKPLESRWHFNNHLQSPAETVKTHFHTKTCPQTFLGALSMNTKPTNNLVSQDRSWYHILASQPGSCKEREDHGQMCYRNSRRQCCQDGKQSQKPLCSRRSPRTALTQARPGGNIHSSWRSNWMKGWV